MNPLPQQSWGRGQDSNLRRPAYEAGLEPLQSPRQMSPLGHIVERCRESCYYFFSRIRMSSSADFTLSFRSHCLEMSPCTRVS